MLKKYRECQKPVAFVLAAFWVIGYVFLIAQADQRQKDRRQIEAAYKACEAVQKRNQSTNQSLASRSPCGEHPKDGENETDKITFLGLRLSEGLLILVTGLLWISTKDLVVGADKTAKRQLRAHIEVESGQNFRQSQKRRIRFEFRPNIVNTGQTPARHVRIVSRMEIVPPNIPSNFDFDLRPVPGMAASEVTVGRDKSKFHSAVFYRYLNARELREIASGAKVVHLWGKVTYLDIFDDPQWTNFSFIIFVSNKRSMTVWHNTEQYNDAS